MVRLRAFLLALALAPVSLAATAEWTGASGVHWSDPGNWVGGRVPVAGDDLVFPAGRPTTATNDLPAGTEFRSMVLATNIPDRYTINGNAIRLGAGGLSLFGAYNSYGETHTLNLPIALAADQTWTLNPVRFAALTVNGAVDVGAFTLTIVDHGLFGPVRFRGPVTGTGRIIIEQPFTWFYETTNFAGSIVTEGRSTRFIGSALGAAHVLQTGGRLHMTRNPTVGALVVAAGEWGGTGNTGDLTLASGSEMRAGAGFETHSFGRRFETVRVTGRVRIEGATLSLLGTGRVVVDMDNGGTQPPLTVPGDEFVIIDNDGSDPVEGTFAPWEGTVWHGFFPLTNAIPQDANVDYTVAYDGGDGNDVVVRAIPAGAVTTTVLTIDQDIGTPAVLTATVTGGTSPATGIVRFVEVINPGGIFRTHVELGTATLDAAGVATLSLPRANGTFFVIYRGDATHRPGVSPEVEASFHGAEIPALSTGALLALIGALAVAGILAFRT